MGSYGLRTPAVMATVLRPMLGLGRRCAGAASSSSSTGSLGRLHLVRLQVSRACSTSSNPPSLSRFPKAQGLYDPAREVDSCGVGMVAHLKGKASHSIVSDANVMLVRMAHRGGCGCDPASGDGAGILTGMPDGFLRKAVQAELGVTLPAAGGYAAGVVFFPKDETSIAACKAVVESQMAAQGLGLLGWRPLPTDNSELGPTSLESEPHSEMLLVAPSAGLAPADFNRELYRLHKLATKAILREPAHEVRLSQLQLASLPLRTPLPLRLPLRLPRCTIPRRLSRCLSRSLAHTLPRPHARSPSRSLRTFTSTRSRRARSCTRGS